MTLITRILLFAFVWISFTMNAKLPQSEKEVLLELFSKTQGENWTITWSLDQPMATWHGVEIEDNHVVGLHLFNNNLVGQLPTSIYQLVNLKVLPLTN